MNKRYVAPADLDPPSDCCGAWFCDDEPDNGGVDPVEVDCSKYKNMKAGTKALKKLKKAEKKGKKNKKKNDGVMKAADEKKIAAAQGKVDDAVAKVAKAQAYVDNC